MANFDTFFPVYALWSLFIIACLMDYPGSICNLCSVLCRIHLSGTHETVLFAGEKEYIYIYIYIYIFAFFVGLFNLKFFYIRAAVCCTWRVIICKTGLSFIWLYVYWWILMVLFVFIYLFNPFWLGYIIVYSFFCFDRMLAISLTFDIN